MMNDYRIESSRLLTRAWALEDVAAFFAMTQDPIMMRFISDGKRWSDDQVDEFFQRQARQLREYGYCLGAMERKEDGEVIGIGGLQPMGQSGEVEVGWWVRRDCWGKGYATESGAAALKFGFEEAGLTRIVSIAIPENERSTHVMEKLGMQFEGNRTGEELKLRNPDLLLAYYALNKTEYLAQQ